MSRLLTARRRAIGPSIPNPGGGGVITPPDPGGYVRISSLGYGDDEPVDVDQGTVLMMDYGPGEGPLLGDIMNAGTIIYDPAKAVEVRARSFTNMLTGTHDITNNGTPRPLSKPITWIWGRPGDMPANLTRGLNFTGNTRRYNSDTQDDFGRIRGYRNMGGKERLIAETPTDVHVPAGADIASGTTSIKLSKGVYWRQGDVVAIPPTFYIKANKPTEYRILNADTNGSDTITFDQPLTYGRAGRLQYIVDAGDGLSYTPGPFTYDPNAAVTSTNGLSNTSTLRTSADQESEIDLRCYIALISTSSCKMTCVDDANWQNDGFGFHIMQMGDATQMNSQWAGIWLDRYGQRGRHARYGFHFHNMSWSLFNSDGTLKTTPVYRGLVNSQSFFRRLGFYRGENRVMTVHNTDGTLIEECSMFGGVGSGLFHEDLTERRNVFNYNIIGDIREPAVGMELKGFDTARANGQFFGPQGVWAGNLDNDFTGNRVCGIGLNGTAWSFPVTAGVTGRTGRCFGDAANVVMSVKNSQAGVQERNVAQSCSRARQMTFGITNEQGNEQQVDGPETTANGLPISGSNPPIPTVFGRFSMFYNLVPYQNRANDPSYLNWTCVAWKEILESDGVTRRDGSWLAFSGGTNTFTDGIKNAICIGHDLYDDDAWRGPQIPFASYHNTINFPNALLINIGRVGPMVRGDLIYWGAAVATEDLYLSGIHKGFISSPGWRLRNVRVMDRAAPLYPEFITGAAGAALPTDLKTRINNRTAGYNRTFAGPIPDPDGVCGFGKNVTNLLNHPHWTTGLTFITDPLDDGQVYTAKQFIGVTIGDYGGRSGGYNGTSQKWSRRNKSTKAVIAESILDYGLSNSPPNIGRFMIDAVPEFEWLRFEVAADQRASTSIGGGLHYLRSGQWIMLSLPWIGSATPRLKCFAIQYPYASNSGVEFAPQITAGSVDAGLTALLAANTTSFYVDTAGGEIHIKFFSTATVSGRLYDGSESFFHEFQVTPS